jgi:hypothetical protein
MYALILLAAFGSQDMRPQPSLDWMAGYWLACNGGREVAETWSNRRGSVMLGTNTTVGPEAANWEQMRIESVSQQENGLSFFAQPRGAMQATEFPLSRWGAREAVFENPYNDFPQRVIYRRIGDRLIGRIEGRSGGREQSMEWHFRSAPLNSRCPRGR